MATIITDIGTVLAGLLTNVSSVVTALLAIDIINYMILASVAIGVIYMVVRLVKSFTGNKLAGGRKRK